VLSVALTRLGMAKQQTVYAFAIFGVMNAVGSVFAGWIIEIIDIRKVLQAGLFLQILACLMIGPSTIGSGLPNEAGIVLAGLGLMGFVDAMMFVPITPEVNRAVSLQIREKLNKDLSNKQQQVDDQCN
jgi:MFS family permease